MPYPPQKSENYQNFGGINAKVSQYLTKITEFLNIQNMDFRTPGSLSSFPGSTQISISGTTGPITGILQKFSNINQIPLGSTFNPLIATTNGGAFNFSGYTFLQSYVPIFQGTTFQPPTVVNGYETFGMYDFVNGGYAYGANGFEFWMAPAVGGSYLQYSLPFPYVGASTVVMAGSTGGISGLLSLFFAFIRYDGLVGPFSQSDFTASGRTGISVTSPGILPGWGVSYSNFGISGLLAWYSLNGSSPKGTSAIFAPETSFTINDAFASYVTTDIPQDILGNFFLGNAAPGFTSVVQAPPSIGSVNPITIELYNNQMFMGGFNSMPDTVWYSNVGELEKRDPENFFEVGADNGDIVSNLKSYFTQLVIFKTRSIYALAGDDPDNFVLAQTTDQYGCLSNSAACVWEQKLWFLDRKGICEYNGANTLIVSVNVEPIFQRMNISAARVTASMVHVKARNEIWCAIPVDGADYNNIIVVYDYISNAWTTRSANLLSYLSQTTKSSTAPLPYFGTYSGMIYQYGQSFLTDNGQAFTSVIRSRFNCDMGNSVEKQFRRLYLDATIPPGTTQNIGINFYTDQGNTPVLSMTMSMAQFQQRIDFGLPAKDLSVEFLYNGGQFLQLNGYTIEFRYQRNT